mmetsp:Transcript_24267/g.59838  ORF Transcript_24267/g.59838 Transcript_24267/m.59838 type:complete len:336 (-) Transcript_24267:104-1111(-)
MSSFLGRIGLLGAGGVIGTTAWDKVNGAGELWAQLKAMLPQARDGVATAATQTDPRLDALAQDMRALMLSGRGQSIVVSPAGGGTGGKMLLIFVPSAGFYLWMRGYRLSDLQWVSSSRFSSAVDSIGKAQEALSKGLSTFREAVAKRLLEFQQQVEERFAAVQDGQQHIEAQVGDVQNSVGNMQGHLAVVDRRVQGLERKLDETQAQLAYTSKGIHLLCSVVSENMGGGNSRTGRELEQFAQYNPLEGAAQWDALEGPAVLVGLENGPEDDGSSAGRSSGRLGDSGGSNLSGSAHALSLFGHRPVLGGSLGSTRSNASAGSEASGAAPSAVGAVH